MGQWREHRLLVQVSALWAGGCFIWAKVSFSPLESRFPNLTIGITVVLSLLGRHEKMKQSVLKGQSI